MTRTTLILGAILAAALGLPGPATAQENTETAAPDCGETAKPVVSQGLPTRPCGKTSGVVIRRGPEVTPEPTPVQTEEDPPTNTPRIIRVPAPSTYQKSSVLLPYAPVAVPSRRASNFGLVLRSGDVTLRIGNTAPYPQPRGWHRSHRRHGDGGYRDAPQGIFLPGAEIPQPPRGPRW